MKLPLSESVKIYNLVKEYSVNPQFSTTKNAGGTPIDLSKGVFNVYAKVDSTGQTPPRITSVTHMPSPPGTPGISSDQMFSLMCLTGFKATLDRAFGDIENTDEAIISQYLHTHAVISTSKGCAALFVSSYNILQVILTASSPLFDIIHHHDYWNEEEYQQWYQLIVEIIDALGKKQ